MLSPMPAGIAPFEGRNPRRPGLSAFVAGLLAAAVSSVLAQAPAVPSAARIPGIDQAVEAAIAAGQTPGAVVLVGQGPRVLHFQAYGVRANAPPASLQTAITQRY